MQWRKSIIIYLIDITSQFLSLVHAYLLTHRRSLIAGLPIETCTFLRDAICYIYIPMRESSKAVFRFSTRFTRARLSAP